MMIVFVISEWLNRESRLTFTCKFTIETIGNDNRKWSFEMSSDFFRRNDWEILENQPKEVSSFSLVRHENLEVNKEEVIYD